MKERVVGFSLGLAVLAFAWSARGDGGTPVLREVRGPISVTLFAEPSPLRAGPAIFDVLLQASANGAPLLSGDVDLRLSGTDSMEWLELELSTEDSGNRLFRGARTILPRAGSWDIELRVVRPDGSTEVFTTSLEVAAPLSPARRYWAFIALTPLGLALFAAHQALCVTRLRARSPGTRRASPSTPRGRP